MIKNKYILQIDHWNPNGTNDAYIIDKNNGEVIDCLDEAFFGIDPCRQPITLDFLLKHIAVSPVEDGSRTIEWLKKYFKKTRS